jgi:multidrug efflux system membrane fusion protein
MVTLILLVLAAGGGAWWWSHRSTGTEGPSATEVAGGRAGPSAEAPGPAGPGLAAGKAGNADPRKSGRGGAPSVVAGKTRRADFEVWSDSLGTVTPLANVTIHSRVDGELLRVHYREGEQVQAGDLLAEIDPRTFQVQLDQASALLARDRALLDNARTDLARYQDLAEHDAVPRQQLDTQRSLVSQYEATQRTDQSAVDSARLQLGFCRITAPISGQAGLRLIDPGNMVHAADATGLVTLAQMDPISVLFSLPQDQLPQVHRRLRAHLPLRLEAFDRAGKERLASGTLSSLDNQIDTTTGSIKLRGKFENRAGMLFPNQFVNVQILMDTLPGVVVMPVAALLRGAQGTYVYVVKDDHTVSVRPVTVGPVGRGEIVIEQGLQAGEQVVLDGTDKLREGMPVTLSQGRPGKSP